MKSVFSNIVRGVALGDAWGDPNEFKGIDQLIKDNPQGPDIPADKLRITDDTQMTLFLADALDESWDEPIETVQDAIISAFLAYADDPDSGSRAPGVTVMGSLRAMDRVSSWIKATNTGSDGSGTVMRTSPTAFLPSDRWVGATAFAAAVTHGHTNAIAAAILNAAVLRLIIMDKIAPGHVLEGALNVAEHAVELGLTDVGDWFKDGDLEFEVNLAKGFDFMVTLIKQGLEALPALALDPWDRNSDPSLHFANSGWRAPFTLVIAMLAADMFPTDPMDALRRAVTTDGDSDTIGAVAGGLIGALWPQLFNEKWDSLKYRFAKDSNGRYVRWIENEVDDYPMATKGWWGRMFAKTGEAPAA